MILDFLLDVCGIGKGITSYVRFHFVCATSYCKKFFSFFLALLTHQLTSIFLLKQDIMYKSLSVLDITKFQKVILWVLPHFDFLFLNFFPASYLSVLKLVPIMGIKAGLTTDFSNVLMTLLKVWSIVCQKLPSNPPWVVKLQLLHFLSVALRVLSFNFILKSCTE